MRRRGFGATHFELPGDGGAPLAGITTCRQELADRRGWSTFSKARPVLVAERRRGAPEGAFPRSQGGTGRSQDVPPGVFRRPPTGGLASPSACRRSAPLVGSRELQFATRAYPAPTQEHGRWRAPNRHSGARASSVIPGRVRSTRTRNPYSAASETE